MVSIAKCEVCGMDFPDTHPSRKGRKFCCRDHFKKYKEIHGCGNKGKTWKETYSPETFKFMKERTSKKGKEHFNYNKQRKDVLVNNLTNNPMFNDKKKFQIKKDFVNNPDETIKRLLEKSTKNRRFYQRIAYERYGKKCSICGQTERQIDVHHKDKNKKNNKIENLQVLCASCHANLHKNPLNNNI